MRSLLSPLEPTGGGVVLPLVLDWTRVGAARGFLWLVVLLPGPVAGGTGLSWRLFCLCPLVVPPAAFDSPPVWDLREATKKSGAHRVLAPSWGSQATCLLTLAFQSQGVFRCKTEDRGEMGSLFDGNPLYIQYRIYTSFGKHPLGIGKERLFSQKQSTT